MRNQAPDRGESEREIMSETAQTTINPTSFINERKRGHKQGERDTLARLGVASTEEAIAAITAFKQMKAQGSSDQAATKAAEVAVTKVDGNSGGSLDLAGLSKLLDERLTPTTAKLEALLKEREEEKARIAAEVKEAEATKAARQKEEAEERAAAAALAKEVKWFKKLAKAEGVDESDPDNMETVLALYEKRIAKMSDEEAEAAFGDDTEEEDRAAFVKAEIAKIKKKAPGLFKSDATGGETVETVKTAATTGKPQGKPDAAASPKTEKRVLDARKLSPKQFAAYRRNPAQFVKEFEAGLIDYETPVAGAKK